jgi:hypothetical protein
MAYLSLLWNTIVLVIGWLWRLRQDVDACLCDDNATKDRLWLEAFLYALASGNCDVMPKGPAAKVLKALYRILKGLGMNGQVIRYAQILLKSQKLLDINKGGLETYAKARDALLNVPNSGNGGGA